MSLPEITPPGDAPAFLVSPHSITEGDVYGTAPMATGSPRRRALRTAVQRQVQVAWLLTDAQMADVDEWFEDALLAGSQQFSCQVETEGEGKSWWAARWLEPYMAEPRNIGGGQLVWSVTGTLVLIGEPSVDGPAATSLGMELLLRVRGTAQINPDSALAIEYSLAFDRTTALRMELALEFKATMKTFRLREGGSFRLREGGGRRVRE